VVDEMGISAPTPITIEHLDEAKERLILARATHLDSLVSKLHEDRVRRVIARLIADLPDGPRRSLARGEALDLTLRARRAPQFDACPAQGSQMAENGRFRGLSASS